MRTSYYVAVTKTGEAKVCNYDPFKRADKYKFGFGPYFSFREAYNWMRHWGLR